LTRLGGLALRGGMTIAVSRLHAYDKRAMFNGIFKNHCTVADENVI